jgi:hypothetical protein
VQTAIAERTFTRAVSSVHQLQRDLECVAIIGSLNAFTRRALTCR